MLCEKLKRERKLAPKWDVRCLTFSFQESYGCPVPDMLDRTEMTIRCICRLRAKRPSQVVMQCVGSSELVFGSLCQLMRAQGNGSQTQSGGGKKNEKVEYLKTPSRLHIVIIIIIVIFRSISTIISIIIIIIIIITVIITIVVFVVVRGRCGGWGVAVDFIVIIMSIMSIT